MKNITRYILLLLLALITRHSFSQDFWEVVPTPDSADIYTVAINKNGDIFLGTGTEYHPGGVYLSSDTGETWEFKGLLGKPIYSIAIDSLNNVFAGTTCKIYKSTDYGESWYQVDHTLGNMISLAAAPNGLMFAGTGTNIGYLLRSMDYGESWDTSFIFPGIYESVTDILLAPSGVFYFSTWAFMGGGGGVYRSVDNGETLEHIGLLYHYVQGLAVNSEGNLFAASYGQYYTGIGGCYLYDEINSNWIGLTGNLNADGIIINSNDDIYLGISNEAGGPGGVYRSLNGGENWQWLNSGLSVNSIIGMWLSPDEYVYALTYGSHTLNRSINSTVTITQEEINRPKLDVFPNPFAEEFYLKVYSAEQYTKCLLTVFDLKGTTVIKIDLSQFSHSQLITIDGITLSSGIYCYNLILDNLGYNGKIIKIN